MSSPPREKKHQIWIGGISKDMSAKEMADYFEEKYGRVESVDTGFPGFCFVEFSELRDAEDAINDLDGKPSGLFGRKVNVKMSTPQGFAQALKKRDQREREQDDRPRFVPRPAPERSREGGRGTDEKRQYPWRVKISNLAEHITWKELKDAGRKIGEIHYVFVKSDRTYVPLGGAEFGYCVETRSLFSGIWRISADFGRIVLA